MKQIVGGFYLMFKVVDCDLIRWHNRIDMLRSIIISRADEEFVLNSMVTQEHVEHSEKNADIIVMFTTDISDSFESTKNYIDSFKREMRDFERCICNAMIDLDDSKLQVERIKPYIAEKMGSNEQFNFFIEQVKHGQF